MVAFVGGSYLVSACIEVVVVLSIALSVLRLVEEWRAGSRLLVKSLSSVGSCVCGIVKGSGEEGFSLLSRLTKMIHTPVPIKNKAKHKQ